MNHKTLTQTVQQFDAMVESAARALFETHGLPLGQLRARLRRHPGGPRRRLRASASPAPAIRGAILMTTRQDLVALAWPAELRHQPPSERDVCDWAGELVNQLARPGEERARAVRPRARAEHAHGRHRMAHPPDAGDRPTIARRYLFDAGRGTVVFYFDAAVADDFVLARTSDESLLSAVEGDVRLF